MSGSVTKFLLDTSALAKLYHEEARSEYPERLVERSGSRFFNLAPVSDRSESVLSLKLRTGEIGLGQAATTRRLAFWQPTVQTMGCARWTRFSWRSPWTSKRPG